MRRFLFALMDVSISILVSLGAEGCNPDNVWLLIAEAGSVGWPVTCMVCAVTNPVDGNVISVAKI